MEKSFSLLFVIFFVFVLGCDENPVQEEPPKVVDISVREGSKIAENQTITVTLNKKVKLVKISVTCATGNTTLDSVGKKATWAPLPYSPPGFETLPWALWDGIPPGSHALTVTGREVNFWTKSRLPKYLRLRKSLLTK